MSDPVRARLNGVESNMSPFFAKLHKAEVLDEPTSNADGTLRGETRTGGRRIKPRTTVAAAAGKTGTTTPARTKAAAKKAAVSAQNPKE